MEYRNGYMKRRITTTRNNDHSLHYFLCTSTRIRLAIYIDGCSQREFCSFSIVFILSQSHASLHFAFDFWVLNGCRLTQFVNGLSTAITGIVLKARLGSFQIAIATDSKSFGNRLVGFERVFVATIEIQYCTIAVGHGMQLC
jgi:hypothetical protein